MRRLQAPNRIRDLKQDEAVKKTRRLSQKFSSQMESRLAEFQ